MDYIKQIIRIVTLILQFEGLIDDSQVVSPEMEGSKLNWA